LSWRADFDAGVSRQLNRGLRHSIHATSVVVEAQLANFWLLAVEERAIFKGIAARCAPALIELEAAGVTNFTAEMRWSFPPGSPADAMQLLIDNDVTDADAINTKPPTGGSAGVCG
jgi:hypothetical protein